MPVSTLRKPTAIASAVALLAGGAVALTADGASKSSKSSQTAKTSTSGTYDATRAAARKAQRDLYDAELAKALGVDVAKVQAAQKTAREAVFVSQLDAMVKAGRLTQAQADELRAAAKNGKLEETLKTQRRAELVTRLAAAVKAGSLTQAQSDTILKNFDAAPADGLGHGFGHFGDFDGGFGGGRGFGGHHRGGFRP